jgi:hypothetical protein
MDSDENDSREEMSEFQRELAELLPGTTKKEMDIEKLIEEGIISRQEDPYGFVHDPPLVAKVTDQDGKLIADIDGEWVEVSDDPDKDWSTGIFGKERIRFDVPLVKYLPEILEVDSVIPGGGKPGEYEYDRERNQIVLPTQDGVRVWQKRLHIANFTDTERTNLEPMFWDWGFRLDGAFLDRDESEDSLTLALCLEIRDWIEHLRYGEETFDAILIDELTVETLYAYVIAGKHDMDVYLLTETPVKSITGAKPEIAFSLERLWSVKDVDGAAEECWGFVDGFRTPPDEPH